MLIERWPYYGTTYRNTPEYIEQSFLVYKLNVSLPIDIEEDKRVLNSHN